MKQCLPGFLTLTLLFFVACQRIVPAECDGFENAFQGDIIRTVADGCWPELNFTQSATKQWVVTRKSQWDSIWTDYSHKFSNTCDTPSVDFTKETVLAQSHGTRHGFKNIHKVSHDDNAKKITYIIQDYNCNKSRNTTQEYSTGYHIVVIPKIADGFTVDFSIKE